MIGMCRKTGKELSGDAHIVQSIQDILTTPIGTRLFLRDYGTNLHELIDNPINSESLADISSEMQRALYKWEPRFIFEKVVVNPEQSNFSDGEVVLDIVGRKKNGEKLRLRIIF